MFVIGFSYQFGRRLWPHMLCCDDNRFIMALLTDKESAVWRINITPMFNLNKPGDIFSSRQSGEGVLNKVLCDEAPLRNSNPYLLYHLYAKLSLVSLWVPHLAWHLGPPVAAFDSGCMFTNIANGYYTPKSPIQPKMKKYSTPCAWIYCAFYKLQPNS